MEERNFGFLGTSFQQSLIKTIIEDRKYGDLIIDILETKYFDNNSFKFIIENIKELYSTYKKIPDYYSLAQKIVSENSNNHDIAKIHLDTLEIIKNNQQDIDFVKDKALNFCKQQNLKKELKNVNNIIENGDFEEYPKIENIIKKALSIGTLDDNVINVFDSPEETLLKENRLTIPLGIDGLDYNLKGGLAKGELGIILAPTGTGKALPVSEKVLTNKGWVTIGSLKVGDTIISSNGKNQKVDGVYFQGIRPIYNITFTDNTSVKCDEEHLWSVKTIDRITSKRNTFSEIVKTSDMMKEIKRRGCYNYLIPRVEPVHFDDIEVDIHPYTFGIILKLNMLPRKFHKYVKKLENKTIEEIFPSVLDKLENFSIEKGKPEKAFIPDVYLYNSLEKRIKLLQGLIDFNGKLKQDGKIVYFTISERLAYNIRELVLSLGGQIKIFEKNIDNTIEYRLEMYFNNYINPFYRALKRYKYEKRPKKVLKRCVKTITYSHDEEAVCIKVSSDDELFVTNDYTLTHNTTILTKIANTAHKHGFNVLQIFFEDNPVNIKLKHYTIWSNITPDEQPSNFEYVLEKIKNAQEDSNAQLKLLKLPSDSTTVNDIRNKIRKMISDGFKIDLLIIDYADCITSTSNNHDEEWKGEGPIMRSLESMASEFNLALWTAVQGSRSSISSDIVTTDQMGGSFKKAQIAHVIISIAKTLEQKEHNLATMTLLKSRIGKDGIVFQNCLFNNEYLEINTDSQDTLLGVEEQKIENKKNRIKEAFLSQQKNN
jgi:replicative DNA helicase